LIYTRSQYDVLETDTDSLCIWNRTTVAAAAMNLNTASFILHVKLTCFNKRLEDYSFLPRDATQSAVMRLHVVRPSVRLSVRL